MNYEQALAYINDYTWSTSRLGLDRTKELLKRLGDPQKKLKFVHVAGTNGKGSTCAMLGAILSEAGYRVGLYPSPYIEDFRERIEINGEMISKEELAAITEKVMKEADAMEDHPSQFELITAIGMLYYLEKSFDIVVLEVGMGGAMDSTNVIDPPEAAVITNIGLDHTEYLGDTIEKIAETKAGIIKPGSDVIVYDKAPSVIDVIKKACERSGDKLYETKNLTETLSQSLDGQTFIYHRELACINYRMSDAKPETDMCGNNAAGPAAVSENEKEPLMLDLSRLGRHQLKNAAVVLMTVEVLKKRGWKISNDAVRAGLKNVQWPARFEVLSKEPLFILDGGHNPQCAEALAENIDTYICKKSRAKENDKRSVTFLIGILADKDYDRILELLKPYGVNYVCITPNNPRALEAKKLALEVKKKTNAAVCVADSIRDAIDKAVSYKIPVVAFGSLYSSGEIRKEFRKEFCHK